MGEGVVRFAAVGGAGVIYNASLMGRETSMNMHKKGIKRHQ